MYFYLFPVLTLSQFICFMNTRWLPVTPTAGYMFPHSPPGGMIDPICSSILNQVSLVGRAELTFLNLNQQLWSGVWIGLIFDIFHLWAEGQVGFPQLHWLSRGNWGLSGRGKVETPACKIISTCHHFHHCYPGTTEKTLYCPDRKYLCPWVGSGDTWPLRNFLKLLLEVE